MGGSTLRYANRAKQIVNAAVVNESQTERLVRDDRACECVHWQWKSTFPLYDANLYHVYETLQVRELQLEVQALRRLMAEAAVPRSLESEASPSCDAAVSSDEIARAAAEAAEAARREAEDRSARVVAAYKVRLRRCENMQSLCIESMAQFLI